MGRWDVRRAKSYLVTLAWLLPASRFKNWLLRSLGHAIDPSARASPCLVLRVTHFEMAENSALRPWNIIKDVERLSFGRQSSMGVNNRIVTRSP